MRASRHFAIAVLVAAGVVAVPLTALAGDRGPSKVERATDTFEYTSNMEPIGFSARKVPLDNFRPRQSVYNSDLAFWGETAIQGTYAGFRLVDIDDRDDPEEIVDWEDCASPTNTVGNQGDIIAWGPRGSRRPELIIRSWNSPTPAPRENFNSPTGAEIPASDPRRLTQPGAFCGDWPMFRVAGTPTHPVNPPATDRGQEGVHIIDVSDPEEPEVVAFVDLPCGSHTETLVPDLRNDRLLVYSNPSSGTVFGSPQPGEEPVHCNGFDIVEVPLDDPSEASYLRFEPTGHPDEPLEDLHPCHDTGVILGDVKRVACAGGSGPSVWTIDPDEGGSKADPEFLYHRDLGTGIGHSASFSWDGEVLIFGHEPGGGTQARCQTSSSVLDRTLFFLDAETGETLAEFLHPRPQTALENCTWHNYNVVPQKRGNVLVAGNYQSGISVVDFSDPEDPEEIAYADPAPLETRIRRSGSRAAATGRPTGTTGYIYEGDMTRGLIVWKLKDRAVNGRDQAGSPQPADTGVLDPQPRTGR